LRVVGRDGLADTVVEPRCAVAQIRRPATPTVARSLFHLLTDVRAAVVELDSVPASAFTGLVGEHGDAGVPGTGVDADLDTVDLGCGSVTILESNRERGVAVDDGAAFGQELASPCWRTGLQRSGEPVQDEHERVIGMGLTALLPGPGGLGGDATSGR
jgi:hypothetical protein